MNPELVKGLPGLTPMELRTIRERLLQMEARAGAASPHHTLADVVRILHSTPADVHFADDLETVNRADRPLANPWDS